MSTAAQHGQGQPDDLDSRAAALADEFLAARQGQAHAGAPQGAAAAPGLGSLVPPEVLTNFIRQIAIEVLKYALGRLGA